MKLTKKQRKVLKKISQEKNIRFLQKKYSVRDFDNLHKLGYIVGTRTDDNGRIYIKISDIGEQELKRQRFGRNNIQKRIIQNKQLFFRLLSVIIIVVIYLIFGKKITNVFDMIDFIQSQIGVGNA